MLADCFQLLHIVSPPAAIALETPALPANMVTLDNPLKPGATRNATDTVDETHEATGATADARLEPFLQICLRLDEGLFASPSAAQPCSKRPSQC